MTAERRASNRDGELLETAVAAARAGGEVLLGYWREHRVGKGPSRRLEVEHKGRNDLVSRADRESEQAILGVILERHPGHAILAEEGGATRGSHPASQPAEEPEAGSDAEHEWIVDPLDGTANFLHGLPVWCVSVAVRCRGELVAGVVLDPVADRLYAASAGGGATLDGEPISVRGGDRDALDRSLIGTGFPFRAHAALDVYLAIFRDVFLSVGGIRRCGSAALDLAWVASGLYGGFFELRLSAWDVAAGALLIREAGGVVSDFDGGEAFLESGNVVAGSRRVHSGLLERVQRHADEAAIERLTPASPLY